MSKKRVPFTKEEKDFIVENWQSMTDPEMAEKLGRTRGSVKGFRRRNHLIHEKNFFTKNEDQYLIKNYPSTNTEKMAEYLGRSVHSIYARAGLLGLEKDEDFLNSRESGRIMPGECKPGSVATQFKAGHVPHNKGKKGVFYPGCEKSWFKPGNSPHNEEYDGAVRIRQESGGQKYMYIRIAKAEWIPLQHYTWQRENGPIPDGMLLTCKDGNTLNTHPDNWEPITRADLIKRNHDHEKAMSTMMKNKNHPTIHLTDAFVASLLAGGIDDLKQKLLENHKDLIAAARANYKLKRQINQTEKS